MFALALVCGLSTVLFALVEWVSTRRAVSLRKLGAFDVAPSRLTMAARHVAAARKLLAFGVPILDMRLDPTTGRVVCMLPAPAAPRGLLGTSGTDATASALLTTLCQCARSGGYCADYGTADYVCPACTAYRSDEAVALRQRWQSAGQLYAVVAIEATRHAAITAAGYRLGRDGKVRNARGHFVSPHVLRTAIAGDAC